MDFKAFIQTEFAPGDWRTEEIATLFILPRVGEFIAYTRGEESKFLRVMTVIHGSDEESKYRPYLRCVFEKP